MKWLKAFLRAGWAMARYAHWLVTVRRLAHFVWLLSKKRDHILGVERLAVCQHCDMYDSEHGTCGHIGELIWNPALCRVEPMGCWCYMNAAARIPAKDCWLRARGSDKGWPDALRP